MAAYIKVTNSTKQTSNIDTSRGTACTHVRAVAGKKITALAAGNAHTAIATDKGALLTFGHRVHTTNNVNVLTPRLVDMLGGRKAKAVAAGNGHTAVVTDGREKYLAISHECPALHAPYSSALLTREGACHAKPLSPSSSCQYLRMT